MPLTLPLRLACALEPSIPSLRALAGIIDQPIRNIDYYYSGGFMLIRLPDGKAETVDFRETAPAAATENMYVKNPAAAQVGGLAVGIPYEIY